MLQPQALSRAAFAPFGDVIETDHARHYPINDGWAERYHDLAALSLTAENGRPALSIFRAAPRHLPVKLSMMERHCLGSQAFVPLAGEAFLIVVAPPGLPPANPDALSVFISDGRQGVNYHPGVWHHPLLAIRQSSDFLVVDRVSLTGDCEEVNIGAWDIGIDV